MGGVDFSTDNWDTWLLEWAKTDGLSVILLIIFLGLALWIQGLVVNRLKKIHLSRLAKRSLSNRPGDEKRVNTIYGILNQALKVTLFVIFGTTILTHVGIELGPMIASIGVVGLALGFGSQELVRDVVTGLFNLLENNMRVGDVVSINGISGSVEKIELRTTALRAYDGTIHVIQNGKINSLSNRTLDWSAATFEIEVDYGSDLKEVIQVMQQVGDTLKQDPSLGKNVLEPIEIAGLDQLGENALVIKARIKTHPGKQWSIKRSYLSALTEEFKKNGIVIPYPNRTVHLVDGSSTGE